MLDYIKQQLNERMHQDDAFQEQQHEDQMNEAILECAHLIQELDDLSIDGTQTDSSRPFTKIDIPIEDDIEITAVELNALDGRVISAPMDATVQEEYTADYTEMKSAKDFFQEAYASTQQYQRESDAQYYARIEEIAKQNYAAYKEYCIQEGLFGFDKMSVNDQRVPARVVINFGKLNGKEYSVKLAAKFEVDKKGRILKKQLDSLLAFKNTMDSEDFMQGAAFAAFSQKLGLGAEDIDKIWTKVTPVELVIPVKPSNAFCVAIGFELDGSGDDIQYIEWHAPIKDKGKKIETTTPAAGEIRKLNAITKGDAIRQEAAMIASGHRGPSRFVQEAIDFGDPDAAPDANPDAPAVSFDAPPADGMEQPAPDAGAADASAPSDDTGAPPADGGEAAPPEGDAAADPNAEPKEPVDTNNVSDQIAEKISDETQADANADADVNIDGIDSTSDAETPTADELDSSVDTPPTDDAASTEPASDVSDADFDNMTIDELLAQGQEKMKTMTMQQLKDFLQGGQLSNGDSVGEPAPDLGTDAGVQEAFFLTRGNIGKELDIHLRKALGILNDNEMEIDQLCTTFRKEGKQLNRVVHKASTMKKVFNETECKQLLKLNHCLTDLMTMLRSNIDQGSIMTVKRMIQAFVQEATGVLQMIEQKNDPGKPVQEGFFSKLKDKFSKEPKDLEGLCRSLIDMWDVDDTVWNAKELSEFVNEQNPLTLQAFIADWLPESALKCSLIVDKCIHEHPAACNQFKELQTKFENFANRFNDLMAARDDRELTISEYEILQELKAFIPEMKSIVTRFLDEINQSSEIN